MCAIVPRAARPSAVEETAIVWGGGGSLCRRSLFRQLQPHAARCSGRICVAHGFCESVQPMRVVCVCVPCQRLEFIRLPRGGALVGSSVDASRVLCTSCGGTLGVHRQGMVAERRRICDTVVCVCVCNQGLGTPRQSRASSQHCTFQQKSLPPPLWEAALAFRKVRLTHVEAPKSLSTPLRLKPSCGFGCLGCVVGCRS